MNLKDFHGVVSKCHCTNPALSMSCKNCFSRGFVAVCLQCSGTGQIKVPVAGAASGDMRSTCDKCGGIGHFGVPKPATWDADHAPVQAESAPVETVDGKDEEADFKEVTAGATAADAIDPLMEAFHEMNAEPKGDAEMDAATDPVRPRAIHWKKWAKMTHAEKLAAVHAETQELVTA
jgi:hypothetical protein